MPVPSTHNGVTITTRLVCRAAPRVGPKPWHITHRSPNPNDTLRRFYRCSTDCTTTTLTSANYMNALVFSRFTFGSNIARALVPMGLVALLGCTRNSSSGDSGGDSNPSDSDSGSATVDSGAMDSSGDDAGTDAADGDLAVPDLPGPMYCDKPSDCPIDLNCYKDRRHESDTFKFWVCQPHGGLKLGDPCATKLDVEACGHGLYCLGPEQVPPDSSIGARCVSSCATLYGEDSVDFCPGVDDECIGFASAYAPPIGFCQSPCEDWLTSSDCDFGDMCGPSINGSVCRPGRKPPLEPGAECGGGLDCGIGRVCLSADDGYCSGSADACCVAVCDYTNPTDTSCADAGLPAAVCMEYEFSSIMTPDGFGVCSVL
jgi:hypothetical protein